MDDRQPVIVGAAQVTAREQDDKRSPIGLIAQAAQAALDDAGGSSVGAALDSLVVVNILAPPYPNPPALLARQLEINPAEQFYTVVGGNTPPWLVGLFSDRIAAGELDSVLLTGGEALATVMRGQGMNLQDIVDRGDVVDDQERPRMLGEEKEAATHQETLHGMHLPVNIYPLFEQALRGRYGNSPAEHNAELGRLCAGLSRVAGDNPYAWKQQALSAEAIATRAPRNRYVGAPYTRRMNANIAVDQSAAVVLMSAGKARALGIDESGWVYPLAVANAHDHWYPAERADLSRSPAIRACAQAALQHADVWFDAIEHLDLYSCFPCAVEIARDELGIPRDDSRPLTLTGGLPFFGGPGNNYAMHGIVEAVQRARADRQSLAMATGVGWYMTKHAVGIYAGQAPTRSWRPLDNAAVQASVDALPRCNLDPEPSGKAEIETYTVMHDRGDEPVQAIIMGRLPDGRRFVANSPEDERLMAQMADEEFLGCQGSLRQEDGRNVFVPD